MKENNSNQSKKNLKIWNPLSWSRKQKMIFLAALPILIGLGYWVYTGRSKSLSEVAEDMVAGIKGMCKKTWCTIKNLTKGAKKGLSK